MTEPLPRDIIPKDPLMVATWASALMVFIKREDVLENYRRDTGDKFVPANTPMDKIVQEGTGQEREFVIRFIKWFNETTWGDLNLKAGG